MRLLHAIVARECCARVLHAIVAHECCVSRKRQSLKGKFNTKHQPITDAARISLDLRHQHGMFLTDC